ncbi:solute carrier family 25 member 38-B-like [Mizuhopecten yessoensis]|uniref:Solute carrier family 25 member 38-B n=1 Tax=Mizuhopecten yessoensis TaxID=6573 RepID=A0A210PTR1_MIZYE|nr:solute carrier family 25 member 38-B-like [Mizuhopecten yessoensis]OWF39897.1 Solute carrier family 25 member 38-B [Mizuhopecten yessoensis]
MEVSPVLKSFLAGTVSGSCSTLLFQPLDLVKTRIQTSVAFGSPTMVTVAHAVIRQDKLLGLWKGLVPSFSRAVPGIGIYFSSIHYLRSKYGSEKPSLKESAMTGMCARAVSGIVVIPFTVLKTRYESGVFNYSNGVGRALVLTYRQEGCRALISGLSPTLMRDVPFSGLYLMFYTHFKQIVNDNVADDSRRPALHFMCGLNAGILASLVTQPCDVIKTLMQLDPKKHAKVLETARYVFEKYGAHGFMRGIVPRTLRRSLMAALAWTVYDGVSRQFGLKA